MSQGLIYTVTEINTIIKTNLENNYSDIFIEGEISNAKHHSSGHFYFTLKDKDAQLKAVMFSFSMKYLKFKPADGLKVIVRGKLTCFSKTGQYQIICTNMNPVGIGSLALAYEQLKEKLAKEGLFDIEHKKKIPLFPQRLAIITSPTGAAIRDILTIINRRFVNLDILIYPAAVQGENAKYEIAEALDYLNNNHKELDVILLGRGGGSLEDLWAFNEEIVARAIFKSNIPIMSCVGHEVDYLISDLVADLRAPTPSAAAELVVQNKEELLVKIDSYNTRLNLSIGRMLEFNIQRLDSLIDRKIFSDPHVLIEEKKELYQDYLKELNSNIVKILDNQAYRLGILKEKLNGLSPQNLLKKGYNLAYNEETNKIIKSLDDIEINEKLRLTLADGILKCNVLTKEKRKNKK